MLSYSSWKFNGLDLTNRVNTAKTQVLMQAYGFTSVPIAKALVEAHKRGVKILAVLDKSPALALKWAKPPKQTMPHVRPLAHEPSEAETS
jgi:hypothetical protein